jgi:hypothetical protein
MRVESRSNKGDSVNRRYFGGVSAARSPLAVSSASL